MFYNPDVDSLGELLQNKVLLSVNERAPGGFSFLKASQHFDSGEIRHLSLFGAQSVSLKFG